MGITIHYRGTMDDIIQVETMENRVLDLVFSLGGRANPFDEASKQARSEQHPAVEQAQAFLMTAMDLEKDDTSKSSFILVLSRASMDIVGGLVQATSDDLDDNIHRALAITQLKRALSGHAYARGAIFGLRSEEDITQEQSGEFHRQLESLITTIHELAKTAWSQGDCGVMKMCCCRLVATRQIR
ncbi:hypothetical protein LF1_04740 [Rubripirellula obstinata]|uniref:Uncharacterized protein n=1 Tax=Rubripirellula obstinata TaxID=406547 RepID=A0A5B1CEU4_9BACT|nr:hypothetical protein [Rubripirellula obstinata]KAA1257983.1 hypothetical protein LF1_04740 [Rubripirellula obstinata]